MPKLSVGESLAEVFGQHFSNIIKGSNKIKIISQKKIKTYGDHRIAMSFAILSLLYKNKLIIDDETCISISYPDFKKHLKKLSTN